MGEQVSWATPPGCSCAGSALEPETLISLDEHLADLGITMRNGKEGPLPGKDGNTGD